MKADLIDRAALPRVRIVQRARVFKNGRCAHENRLVDVVLCKELDAAPAVDIAAEMAEISEFHKELIETNNNLFAETVEMQKTINALKSEPVRHGKWMNIQRPGSRLWCSECKSAAPWGEEHNYCPKCGAKMEGVQE